MKALAKRLEAIHHVIEITFTITDMFCANVKTQFIVIQVNDRCNISGSKDMSASSHWSAINNVRFWVYHSIKKATSIKVVHSLNLNGHFPGLPCISSNLVNDLLNWSCGPLFPNSLSWESKRFLKACDATGPVIS